MVFIGMKFKAC